MGDLESRESMVTSQYQSLLSGSYPTSSNAASAADYAYGDVELGPWGSNMLLGESPNTGEGGAVWARDGAGAKNMTARSNTKTRAVL